MSAKNCALVKRSSADLKAAPQPRCPADLEALSLWYFGTPLHLSKLSLYCVEDGKASAQYEVREEYSSYHGENGLFSSFCIKGYDYSRDFWRHVIGDLYCGGIASRSYGQAKVIGESNVSRLKEFEECLRQDAVKAYEARKVTT